jgi:hypothetical protein
VLAVRRLATEAVGLLTEGVAGGRLRVMGAFLSVVEPAVLPPACVARVLRGLLTAPCESTQDEAAAASAVAAILNKWKDAVCLPHCVSLTVSSIVSPSPCLPLLSPSLCLPLWHRARVMARGRGAPQRWRSCYGWS